MIIALGDLETLVGRSEEVVELLSATQDQILREPGCLAYTFAEVIGDPGHYVVTQEWRDEAAFTAHYSSQPLVEYLSRVGELLARPTEMRIYRVTETVHPVDPGPMDPDRAD
jgi:quinol monooxygenase YgiN